MTKVKLFIITLAVAALAACGASNGESASESASYTTQNAVDFAATASSPGTVILDVRRADEFAAGHLFNAVNIDVESADFAQRVAALDKTVTYAVYCHSGRRSLIAVEQMASAGFNDLYNLDGGIQAWVAAGQAITQ